MNEETFSINSAEQVRMKNITTKGHRFAGISAAFALALLAPLTGVAETAPPPACSDDSGWSEPAAPFRVHGDTWYVGTCGITALLVTSKEGHVLIDGATPEAGEQIVNNIRTLGFDPQDVRYLLLSHEHFDHAGGLAEVQRATGAPLLARAAAADTLRRGASDRGDPQFLSLEPFPAVKDVQVIADDARVSVGALVIETIATPGHTYGSTSWTWRSCEDGDCRRIAYADSLTPISDDEYRYSDDKVHPGAVQRFRESLARVAALPCDILITPHPSASGLWSRIGADAKEPLVNAGACRAYAEVAGKRLDRRLAEETERPEK